MTMCARYTVCRSYQHHVFGHELYIRYHPSGRLQLLALITPGTPFAPPGVFDVACSCKRYNLVLSQTRRVDGALTLMPDRRQIVLIRDNDIRHHQLRLNARYCLVAAVSTDGEIRSRQDVDWSYFLVFFRRNNNNPDLIKG